MASSTYTFVRKLLHDGELEGARKAVDDGISRNAGAGDPIELWQLRLARAEILTLQGHVEEALGYLESSPEPSERDSESIASLRMQRGHCAGLLGRARVSHCLLIEAECLARQGDLRRLLGEVLLCRAFAFFREKDYPSSSEIYRSVLELSQELSDWYLRGHGFWGVGKNLMIQCKYADAMPWLGESLRIFEAEGARLSISTVWSELGICYLGLGDDQKAMELFRRSEDVDYKAGLVHSYQIVLASIGSVYLHRRDCFTALSYYQRALSLAREIKDPVSVKKWTYNINLAYARIKAVDKGGPMLAPERVTLS